MNALTPIARPRETDAERRDRQLDWLLEMGELGMKVARVAAARALEGEATDPDQPAPEQPRSDPTLAFARATRAVRQAIALETRIAAGEIVSRARPPAPDPRRPKLRQALHKIADAEPDRAERAQLRRHVDERIEEELLDPDLPLSDAFIAICDGIGLHVDVSTLPDELLGLPPTSPKPDGGNQPVPPLPPRHHGPGPPGP